MEVEDERLSSEAFLHIARQQSLSLQRIDQTLDKMRGDGQEMRERMIRIEMSDTKATLAALETKVEDLEKIVDGFRMDKARLQGAAGLLDWVQKNYQGLGVLAMAAYVMLKGSHLVP